MDYYEELYMFCYILTDLKIIRDFNWTSGACMTGSGPTAIYEKILVIEV